MGFGECRRYTTEVVLFVLLKKKSTRAEGGDVARWEGELWPPVKLLATSVVTFDVRYFASSSPLLGPSGALAGWDAFVLTRDVGHEWYIILNVLVTFLKEDMDMIPEVLMVFPRIHKQSC